MYVQGQSKRHSMGLLSYEDLLHLQPLGALQVCWDRHLHTPLFLQSHLLYC
jgi:hypothetical protein